MTELFDLWALWSSGPLPHETTFLWGLPLWWWERVGTVVQVIAILGLIFEIIGERRLAKAAERLKEPPKWLLVFTGDAEATAEQKEAQERGEEIKTSAGEGVFVLIVLALTILISFYFASFYVLSTIDPVGRFLIEYLPRTMVNIVTFIVAIITWIPSALVSFILVVIT